MDFVIVANAWGAGIDNPTSKHRIALELARRGHRVLWIEGAGMRTPSVGSGSDRLRVVRKILAALRGARRVEARRGETADGRPQTADPRSALPIWVLSPLFIPMPKYERVRQLNGVVGAWTARLWCVLLGFREPMLINYVPVLAEVMRRWGRGRVQGAGFGVQGASESLAQGRQSEQALRNIEHRTPNTERRSRGDSLPASTLDVGRSALDVCVDGATTGQVETRLRSGVGVQGAVGGRRARVVYHCVDRWDAFAMYDSGVMAEMDRRCCDYAELVIASADELRQRCLRWNPNTHLVTHGVDHAHFAQAAGGQRTEDGGQRTDITPPPSTLHPPADLPSGPIIGFFGLVSEWVDQALVLRLARAFPGAQVVLIGKADVEVAALRGLPNIHLLGPRPFRDLPAYLAQFTVGIIPFVVNDLTRAVNPIKLREMLSGGCPVVSSALPEVAACVEQARVERWVVVAADADGFEAGVRGFLEAPLDLAARRELSERMRAETWEAKVDEILRLVGVSPSGRAPVVTPAGDGAAGAAGA